MRVKTTAFACAAIAVLVSAAAWEPAQAGDRGSVEDQMACTPDVYRLCSNYVPDEDAIVACLKRNVGGLSRACHQVMTRPDTPASANGEDD